MSELISTISKDIFEKIKRNIMLYTISLLVILNLWIYKKSPELKFLISDMLDKFYNMINEQKWILIIAVTIFGMLYILMRKSEQEFQKMLSQQYDRIEEFKSNTTYPIMVTVSDGYVKQKQSITHERTITLFNSLVDNVELLKGNVEFYKSNVRVSIVDFNIENLDANRGHRMPPIIISRTDSNWDTFYIWIELLKTKNVMIEKERLFGIHFIRTHYLVMNYFNYIRFGKIKIPYEVTWLKRNVIYKGKSYINHLVSPKKLKIGRRGIRYLLNYNACDLLRAFLIYIFLLMIGLLILYSLIRFAILLLHLGWVAARTYYLIICYFLK